MIITAYGTMVSSALTVTVLRYTRGQALHLSMQASLGHGLLECTSTARWGFEGDK
jgi:hypothetical protein